MRQLVRLVPAIVALAVTSTIADAQLQRRTAGGGGNGGVEYGARAPHDNSKASGDIITLVRNPAQAERSP